MPTQKNSLVTQIKQSTFFKPHLVIVSDDALKHSVSFAELNIDHVPNKKIGHPKASINVLRMLIYNSLPYFGDLSFASAYLSLLYRTAQCGEFSHILYNILGPQLPNGTIIEIFVANWTYSNHAYLKVKLPRGCAWVDGERVKFCDAWYKKSLSDTPGVYSTSEMNRILNMIGQGEEPTEIISLMHRTVDATGPLFGIGPISYPQVFLAHKM